MKESDTHLSEAEIWEYIDNPAEFSHREMHLSSCPVCQRLFAECNAINADLSLLESFEPSHQFTSRVVSEVISTKTSFRWFGWVIAASLFVGSGVTLYSIMSSTEPVNAPTFIYYGLVLAVVVLGYVVMDAMGRLNAMRRDATSDVGIVG